MKRRLAVALEYGERRAPVVSARGDGELAERIIAEARRQGIFIAEDPQLVALLSRLETDEPIPPGMYVAVAVILSWVYWLKGMRPGDQAANAPVRAAPDQASS
jgi:flagellar biosynthesis protein